MPDLWVRRTRSFVLHGGGALAFFLAFSTIPFFTHQTPDGHFEAGGTNSYRIGWPAPFLRVAFNCSAVTDRCDEFPGGPVREHAVLWTGLLADVILWSVITAAMLTVTHVESRGHSPQDDKERP